MVELSEVLSYDVKSFSFKFSTGKLATETFGQSSSKSFFLNQGRIKGSKQRGMEFIFHMHWTSYKGPLTCTASTATRLY